MAQPLPDLHPLAENVATVNLQLECSPCFKRICPLGHTNCLRQLPQHGGPGVAGARLKMKAALVLFDWFDHGGLQRDCRRIGESLQKKGRRLDNLYAF